MRNQVGLFRGNSGAFVLSLGQAKADAYPKKIVITCLVPVVMFYSLL